MAPLTAGMPAPAFILPNQDDQPISLADFTGRKLVIFFYPRANTPGCTREAIDFTRLAQDFSDCDTDILGVSADPPKKQTAFRNKHDLTITLASDTTHEMLLAYGVWGKKLLYGKMFDGITRTTVLIDREGQIHKIWPKVKVDGHADQVLAAARQLP